LLVVANAEKENKVEKRMEVRVRWWESRAGESGG
jgi:hypothetical protein